MSNEVLECQLIQFQGQAYDLMQQYDIEPDDKKLLMALVMCFSLSAPDGSDAKDKAEGLVDLIRNNRDLIRVVTADMLPDDDDEEEEDED